MITEESDYPIRVLTDLLQNEINRLFPVKPKITTERIAYHRLLDVAVNSPPVLTIFAGEYLKEDVHLETLADCSRIHLYARILDDALDENLPVHRQNLLLSQPMYLGSVGRLAARHIDLWDQRVLRDVLKNKNKLTRKTYEIMI